MKKIISNKRFFIMSNKIIFTNKLKYVFLFVSLILSFVFIFLTIGAYFGFSQAIEKLPYTYLNYNKFYISQVERRSLNDSPLEILKETRPTFSNAYNNLKELSDFYLDYNLDYFINGNKTIKYNNKLITNLTIELYYISDSDIDIYVNDYFESNFLNNFNETSLYKAIDIELTNNYVYGDYINEEYIEVNEEYKSNNVFYVTKVLKEFKYLNVPKIYIPYSFIKKDIIQNKVKKINRTFIKDYSWYDLIKNCENNSEIGGFSLNFWAFNKDVNKIYRMIDNDKQLIKISNSSYSNIASFSSISNIIIFGFIIFSIISITVTILLLFFVLLSISIKEKRNIATLIVIGETNFNISKIYLLNTSVVFILSLFISSILSIIIKNILNTLSSSFINLNKCFTLIYYGNVYYVFYLNIIILIIFIISVLITKISIKSYNNLNIGNILKEE